MSQPTSVPQEPATRPVAPIPMASRAAGPRRLVLPIIGGLLLAVVGFGAGIAFANATSSPAQAGDRNGFAGNFGPNASARPRGGFGGGAAGTIASVSSDQLTLTTATGASRLVLLTPSTTVSQVTATTGSISSLSAGQTVTIVGSANPDGSVTATRVIVGDIGSLGFGGGGFGRGGLAPSPTP